MIQFNSWPPAIVFHNSNFPRLGASARGPFVFVRSEHQGNKALLAHELEHVRQWWATFGFHSFLYLLFPKYRKWAELRGYKVQIAEKLKATPKDQKDLYFEYYAKLYATFLDEKYNIPISYEEAFSELMKT